jgi:putative peptidoglycan lipid II flippase
VAAAFRFAAKAYLLVAVHWKRFHRSGTAANPPVVGGDVSGKWQDVRQRFARVHTDHKRIARAAAWVMGFVLVGKLASAAKEMAVAWRYGVSETVDAYQLATTLVFWLPGVLVCVLTIVLVPMFVRLRQSDQDDRSYFLQELHAAALVLGAIMGVVSLLVAPLVLPLVADKLSVESRQIAWSLTRGMAPLALPSMMLSVYSARLMARERQINTLLEGVPAAGIVLLILLWPPGTNAGPLLWGTVLGIVVQTVWSWRLAGRADGATGLPRFSLRSRHWSELYAATGIMVVGQFVLTCITPLDQYTAAQLGNGAIATLGYANRVIALLGSIGAMAIARAILPVMSDLNAAGQRERARDISLKWTAFMLAAGALGAVIAWALAPWGIGLLFERGAFTAQDTHAVAGVFRWGVIQLPFSFAGLVLVQLLVSEGQYSTIAALAASNLIVKLALNPLLSARMGIGGITLATGLMYAWWASSLSYAVFRIQSGKRRTHDGGSYY